MERKGQGRKKNSVVKKANTIKSGINNNNHRDAKYIHRSSGNNIKNSHNNNLDSRTQKKNSMKNYENNIPNEDIYKYITGDNRPQLQRGQGFNDIPFVNSNFNYPSNYMNVPQPLDNRIPNYNYKKASSFNNNIYNNNHLDDFTNVNLNNYNYNNEYENKKRKKKIIII
jgi:hypothetical protein